ncbi:beta-ketoacyl synthase N-terminal-like domain-containing protein [Streptomyces sp. MJP52]|uniref:beta-ketoacyl synthase N-terminal-like domain-containing protein n=1 Tax=Streptomyces sp. MJP52 TaxID=2940555 RepID=UPI00247632B9|nr:beta-ketoacyl synthase N-terminal-like domain-containing protein [Streptomyces sp. MJP52]MDH6229361.1 acyl transferase domain-containing protein [Streptomyces sp. MJP52]
MDVRDVLTRYRDGLLDRADAAHLLSSLTGSTSEARETPPAPDDAPAPHGPPPRARLRQRTDPGAAGPGPVGPDAVAVVGMAGRYPGADDLDAFWRSLGEPPAAAPPAPPRPGPPLPGHALGARLLGSVAEFDPEFFGLAEDEARLMDPQERLLLETAWEALEQAGLTGSRLDALTGLDGRGRDVGVFVGLSSADYLLLGAEEWARGGREMPHSDPWGPAGRLVRLLALNGPPRSVWGCGLTALEMAVAAVAAGECAAAVAGGAELLLHPSRARAGAGEGAGALVLRPLGDALTDGDPVLAVVRTAPAGTRPLAQEPEAAAARETCDAAGRRVGDAGSATAIAAVTAAVLHLDRNGPAPAPDDGPCRPRTSPRRAVVEPARLPGGGTTGWGGPAPLVLEECPPRPAEPAADAAEGAAEAVLLSGPTPGHLAASAQRLADWLDARDPQAVDLPALAGELRLRRLSEPCRLAMDVRDVPGLRAALEAFLRTGRGAADLRKDTGDPHGLSGLPETDAYLASLWRAGHREQVTGLWLSGVRVRWPALDAGRTRRPHAAPATSVFLRRPLWLRDGRETAG